MDSQLLTGNAFRATFLYWTVPANLKRNCAASASALRDPPTRVRQVRFPVAAQRPARLYLPRSPSSLKAGPNNVPDNVLSQ